MFKELFPGLSEGETRSFNCEYCEETTEHVQLSLADGHEDDSTLNFIGRVNDWNPVVTVLAGVQYRCKECGIKTTKRGLFSKIIDDA